MPLSPTPEWRASGDGLVTALTFDDGPSGADTAAVLDLLAERGLRATFCVVGSQVRAPGGADLLRRTVAAGHVLACHAMTYADLGDAPADVVERDLRDCLATIEAAVPGAPVPFFRAPNGSWGRTAAVAVGLGLQPLAVVNTIGDWETQAVPTLVDRLRAAMRPGEVVLLHDGGGDRRGTVAALTTVLDERLAAGWRCTLPRL